MIKVIKHGSKKVCEELYVGRVVHVETVFEKKNISPFLDKPDWRSVYTTYAWVWEGDYDLPVDKQFKRIDCSSAPYQESTRKRLEPEVTPLTAENAIMFVAWYTFNEMRKADKREKKATIEQAKGEQPKRKANGKVVDWVFGQSQLNELPEVGSTIEGLGTVQWKGMSGGIPRFSVKKNKQSPPRFVTWDEWKVFNES